MNRRILSAEFRAIVAALRVFPAGDRAHFASFCAVRVVFRAASANFRAVSVAYVRVLIPRRAWGGANYARSAKRSSRKTGGEGGMAAWWPVLRTRAYARPISARGASSVEPVRVRIPPDGHGCRGIGLIGWAQR